MVNWKVIGSERSEEKEVFGVRDIAEDIGEAKESFLCISGGERRDATVKRLSFFDCGGGVVMVDR